MNKDRLDRDDKFALALLALIVAVAMIMAILEAASFPRPRPLDSPTRRR